MIVWFTGLSGAGKTTIARLLANFLNNNGIAVELLDGDELRANLCWDLGFEKTDRDENIRRIGYIAGILSSHNVVAIVSAISPYRKARESVREKSPRGFLEVYVNSPVEVCELRDVKGLYRRARLGEIKSFTGLSDPYEPPINPEVECCTDCETIEQSLQKVLNRLAEIAPDVQSQCIRCSPNDSACPNFRSYNEILFSKGEI